MSGQPIHLSLIHGWGANRFVWNPILSALKKHFVVHIVDLPGYDQEVENSCPDDIGTLAAAVLSQTPDRSTWVAWSLGASAAIEAATIQPDRIEKLQLISPTPRFLNSPDWKLGIDETPFQSLGRLFAKDYAKALKRFLILQLQSSAACRTMASDLHRLILQSPPPTKITLENGLRILAGTDSREQLGQLQPPIQVIAGIHDQVIPCAASRMLAESVLNLHSYHEFDAGHLPFLEKPESYLECLNDFVSDSE